jgi:hypothetical protein
MLRARVLATLTGVALLTAAIAGPSMASTVVTPNGTWTAYPGQSTTYTASVQQPINADGTSNFKANGKAVIPVKFALSEGTGDFVFESFADSDPATYGYSFLNFAPSVAPTFAEITNLSAVYDFTVGDCHVGSMRWTVYLRDTDGVVKNLDVHYQPDTFAPNCAPGTSSANLITSPEKIFVTQEFNGTHSFPSPYNNAYADVVAHLGGLPVLGMNLIVDSGFAGNQKVALTSATVGVGGSSPYTQTFTPQAGSPVAATCPSAQASIKITKADGSPSGEVNEPVSVQPQDNNGLFRIVDCKYMYNLATSSLDGAGTYTVKATIGGSTFTVGSFDLK